MRLIINILVVVVVLAGMWHGLTITFLIFALYHAFFILIEKLGVTKKLEQIGKIPSTIYTFSVVLIGWAIFKSSSVNDLGDLLQNLFGITSNEHQVVLSNKVITTLIIALFLSFRTLFPQIETLKNTITDKLGVGTFLLIKGALAIFLLVVSISYVTTEEFIPFIYSKF